MKFPWNKYEELPTKRHKTLQAFVTTRCNRNCPACFARNVMDHATDMTMDVYHKAICDFIDKGGEKINLIGGEPLLHPKLERFLHLNRLRGLATTIYTNGYKLAEYNFPTIKRTKGIKDAGHLVGVKIRVGVYHYIGIDKPIRALPWTDFPIEICYMVSPDTDIYALVNAAKYAEEALNCRVFFISSIRELDNPKKEFFADTIHTMPILTYKQLVHDFLYQYNGDMEIHISKRGVFESTLSPTGNKCRFVNIFPDGRIIQCPYDVINLRYQPDYELNERFCQHNSTCLMSKIVVKRKT